MLRLRMHLCRWVAGGVGVLLLAGGFTHVRGDLLVSDNFGNQVLRYDHTTGAFLGVVVSSDPTQNGGLSGPVGLRLNSQGNLLVTSQSTNSILEYDLASGAFLGTYASAGNLAGPADLRYAPNGNLMVANFFGDSVSAFASDGTPLGAFTSGGPGIAGTSSFAYGADGHLYVGSFNSGTVQRFDGATGNYLDDFVTGLAAPSGLLFDDDGSLWLTDLFGQSIVHYSSSGSLLGSFSTGANTFPSHILVNPNNSDELLVALTGAGGIYRYGKDGTAFGIFAGGGGLIVPGQSLFISSAIPEPGMLGFLSCAALVIGCARRRRRSCPNNLPPPGVVA